MGTHLCISASLRSAPQRNTLHTRSGAAKQPHNRAHRAQHNTAQHQHSTGATILWRVFRAIEDIYEFIVCACATPQPRALRAVRTCAVYFQPFRGARTPDASRRTLARSFGMWRAHAQLVFARLAARRADV